MEIVRLSKLTQDLGHLAGCLFVNWSNVPAWDKQ